MPFFHVFVIGSAGFDSYEGVPGSKGQLPSVDNLQEFMSIRAIDSKTPNHCYFYFIDPRHLEVKSDVIAMQAYQNANIPFSFVNRPFSWDTFRKSYRIESNDHVLMVDYANYSTSEYEFSSRFGVRNNWHYWCPGCAGSRLDVEQAYIKARAIPSYSIHGSKPFPIKVSKDYREGVMKELNQLLIYARLLPATSSDPRPPNWILAEVGKDEDTWAIMRESAYQVLSAFFAANGKDYTGIPVTQWYTLVRDIIFRS